MRLSIRSKVLATYGLLAALLLVVLVTGLARLNRIGARLDVIRDGYFPISKTVDSFLGFNHLDPSFDVRKIVANRENRPFLDSVLLTNPKLMEGGLRRGLEDTRETLTRHPSAAEEQRMGRIATLIDELVVQHRRYTQLIASVMSQIHKGEVEAALARNDELQAQKKLVRAKIEFLTRRIDEQIRDGIHVTVAEERKAALWTLGLSIVSLVLAVFIGLVALFSLRPLARLKRAAQEIAAGDLNQRVAIRTKDEVGDLAQEFDRMADSIQQRDEALRLQQDKLLQTEKMAVVGRMASKISHEIRNPLNALGLNLEMLEDEIQAEEGKRIVKATAAEIDRLNRVAEHYLSIARPTRSDATYTDLEALLKRLETLVQPECREKQVSFMLELDSPLPPLKTDPSRLEQAMLNLVRNAMEAVERGGTFGMKAAQMNGNIRLEVWDRGRGIPPEQLGRIFDPFFTTKDKGTGLGLSITHEIIREQGGTIECRSEPRQGTRFTISLPIAGHELPGNA